MDGESSFGLPQNLDYRIVHLFLIILQQQARKRRRKKKERETTLGKPQCRLSRSCHNIRPVKLQDFPQGTVVLLPHVYRMYTFFLVTHTLLYPTLASRSPIPRVNDKEIRNQEEKRGVRFIMPHRPPVLSLGCSLRTAHQGSGSTRPAAQ